VTDYTRAYTTDTPPGEILDLAEAYLVGLRGFSVPLNYKPTEDSAVFHLRGGPLALVFGGHPTVKLSVEKREAKTRLTITANRKQLLEAMDAWVSSELGATATN
jgi:hypothetical protein